MTATMLIHMQADVFFYGCRDHRDLHSFPTRRSSDLVVARGAAWHRQQARWRWRRSRRRSEEHTSELQSQSNLVCRLLLEKKKRVARLMLHTPTATSILVCLSMVQLMTVFLSRPVPLG